MGKNYDLAKVIFDNYDGSYFQMKRDDRYREYKQYSVPKSMEMQWILEKKENAKKYIIKCENMSDVATNFGKYCHYIKLRRDKKDIDIINNYILSHQETLDSYTLYRCVLEYIEVLRFFNKWSGKRREGVLRLLGRILNKDISISEDYKVKGENLDYINEQKLKSQIIRTIEYWSNPHTE